MTDVWYEDAKARGEVCAGCGDALWMSVAGYPIRTTTGDNGDLLHYYQPYLDAYRNKRKAEPRPAPEVQK